MKKSESDVQSIIRRIMLILLDVLSIAVSAFMALFIRYELSVTAIESRFLDAMWKSLPIVIIVTIAIFAIFRLYSSIWRFAGINEMEKMLAAGTASAVVYLLVILVSPWYLPRSFYFIYLFCLLICLGLTRFGYRALRYIVKKRSGTSNGSNVMIIGAGEAGNMITREMISNEMLHKKVCCIIDDDSSKIGSYMQGIKIVGNTVQIPHFVVKYDIDEIILAIPSAGSRRVSEIVNICKDLKCIMRTLPGIKELVDGEVSTANLRNVEIEDLLGREPVNVDLNQIMSYVMGKTVLVTGGGGSIGSELCRQLASHGVGRLIIVDIYENNAYEIQQELKKHFPELELIVLIASVRNSLRIRQIFEKYKPEIVYHAAAHKHVPLMETSPNEAIKNNVFGTLKTVRAADEFGVEKFVLISTDKAVNPTNIMGASKRLCEMIVQTYNRLSKTEFVAVRFGNVLGSNGSVIPLFKQQIAEGGPVTVTHPDITRFFMTISEAVSLVLQAGAYAKGGEIFVLDMGEPVKILELAENVIRLSGYTPYKDIDIKFTGLRPGEKLYEEILMEEEGLQNTQNNKIHIGKPIELNEEEFVGKLDELYTKVINEPEDIKAVIEELVPTYRPEK